MKKLITSLKKVPDYFNHCLLAGVVYAQAKKFDILPPEGFKGIEGYSVPGIVTTGIKLALIIAAVVAFIFLIVGGIKWITSGGDKEGTAKAQSTITAALIGLVIVFAAWALITLLSNFFGIDILGKLEIPQVKD